MRSDCGQLVPCGTSNHNKLCICTVITVVSFSPSLIKKSFRRKQRCERWDKQRVQPWVMNRSVCLPEIRTKTPAFRNKPERPGQQSKRQRPASKKAAFKKVETSRGFIPHQPDAFFRGRLSVGPMLFSGMPTAELISCSFCLPGDTSAQSGPRYRAALPAGEPLRHGPLPVVSDCIRSTEETRMPDAQTPSCVGRPPILEGHAAAVDLTGAPPRGA